MRVFLTLGLLVAGSFARKGFGPTEQEWGYVTVRPGAHMFWWLHQTSAPVSSCTKRPLFIWLQGGPGASSTGYGNFAELGPWTVDLKPRNTTWIKDVNVLFVDNPVGTGFSYVDSEEALTTTNGQIAEDFLVLLKGFYKAVPELSKTPLYIFSESYGGKMAIEIALVLDQAIKKGDLKINFVGVGLGDAWISPIDSTLTWAPYLLHVGAVDQQGYERIQEEAEESKKALDEGQSKLAYMYWRRTQQAIFEATHDIDFYNILTPVIRNTLIHRNRVTKSEIASNDHFECLREKKSQVVRSLGVGGHSDIPIAVMTRGVQTERNIFAQEGYSLFCRMMACTDSREKLINPAADTRIMRRIDHIMNTKVKEALKLNVTFGGQSSSVFNTLTGDFMKPVTHIVERVLNETDIKVAVFNGQLDLIVDTPGTVIWVDNLRFKGFSSWDKTRRNPIYVKNVLEGYSKKLGNLGMYWVNRAGHMVPADNPAAMDYILCEISNNYEP